MRWNLFTQLQTLLSISRRHKDVVCSRRVGSDRERRFRTGSRSWSLLLALLAVGVVSQCFPTRGDGQQPVRYFRLQLKHGGQYLDADHCGSPVSLNPGSTFENGACELWRLVPAADGWNRLQLKHGGQYLDADHCGSPIGLNPGSTFEGGACQLWRLVPAGGGWSRLQLKHGGLYLDADHCTAKLGLNGGSTFEDGACQLWRMVPEAQRID
jgi:hypothetical protein